MKKLFFVKIVSIITACLLLFGGWGCKKNVNEQEISVFMPDGAPALAMAKLLKKDTETDGVTYKVVKSELIASKVTNRVEEKNADVCVLPLTAAAKLLGNGEKYRMLGSVTQGNVYLISKDETCISSENISALTGKTIGVLQMDNVPGLVFKTLLEQYGLAWERSSLPVENAVALEGISGANEVSLGKFDYYVLAEPAVSVQVNKNGFHIVGDLQALYGAGNGYPQAVVVVKNTLLTEKKDWVREFAQEVSLSTVALLSMSGEEIVSAVTAHLEDTSSKTSLNAQTLTLDVLGRCGVRYVSAKECFTAANVLLQKFLEIQPQVTVLPKTEFYWTE